jgi:arsenate reductase
MRWSDLRDGSGACANIGLVDKVIFACRHSAGRSQMATAFFNQLADPGRAQALAAGTTPAPRVHPEVVEVMREVGLDLSHAEPQLLTTELAVGARHLVTMGCGEECPYLPGLEVMDWALHDPKGQPIERVREIRDEVRRRVESFVKERGWSREEG